MEKDLGNVWKQQGLASGQYKIVQKELIDLRNGNPHFSWKSLKTSLNCISGKNLSMIDVGCGAGYMYEVVNILLPDKFNYTGVDFSHHMLEIAQKDYPKAKYIYSDIRQIESPDHSFDVVMSCAVIVHVPEWKKSIKELCRISKSYVVLHNTPTAEKYESETKLSYNNIEILFQRFELNDIFSIFKEMGFDNIYKEKTNSDPNNFHYTLVFRRL